MTDPGRIIHGVTSDLYVRPVRVDRDGHPQVDVASGTIQAQAYGYNGSSWVASGIPQNYAGVLSLRNINNTLSSSPETFMFQTVPADEVWILTNLVASYSSSPPPSARLAHAFRTTPTGAIHILGEVGNGSIIQGYYYSLQGNFYYGPGYVICLTAYGTIGHAVNMWGQGYRFKVA